MNRSRLAKIIVLFIVFAPILVFLFGSFVMWLWNNTLVPVLHVSTVTLWQAVGILVLSKILFSSFGGSRGPRGYYMTSEQKEKFKEEWRNRSRKWGYRPGDSETNIEQGNQPM